MASHVTAHEPHQALFVSNERPLQFYEALVSFARTQEKKAIVLAEIHESFGNDVAELFRSHDFYDITLREDLQGKHRMVKATFEKDRN